MIYDAEENFFVRTVVHSRYRVPSRCFEVQFETTIQQKLTSGQTCEILLCKEGEASSYTQTKGFIAYSKQGSGTPTKKTDYQLNY